MAGMMQMQGSLESFKRDPIHLFLAFQASFEEKKMGKEKQSLKCAHSSNRQRSRNIELLKYQP